MQKLFAFVSGLILCTSQPVFAQTRPVANLSASRLIAKPVETQFSGEGVELGHAVAIVADEQGLIYLGDGIARTILVIDPKTRKAVRRIGKRGEGPGEMRQLSALAWMGDTLVAYDASLGRLTLFTKLGRVVGTRPWPEQLGCKDCMTALFSGVGGVYSRGIKFTGREKTSSGSRGVNPENVFSFVASSNAVRTLPLPKDTLVEGSHFDCENKGFINTFPAFFGQGPLRALTPTGYAAYADPVAFKLTVYNARTGAVARVIIGDSLKRGLTNEAWAKEATRYRMDDQTAPTKCYVDGRTASFASMRPKYIPQIRSVTGDASSRFWVESYDRGTFWVDVVHISGEFRTRFRVQERDRSIDPYARGNKFYYLSLDEDDTQIIHVVSLDR